MLPLFRVVHRTVLSADSSLQSQVLRYLEVGEEVQGTGEAVKTQCGVTRAQVTVPPHLGFVSLYSNAKRAIDRRQFLEQKIGNEWRPPVLRDGDPSAAAAEELDSVDAILGPLLGETSIIAGADTSRFAWQQASQYLELRDCIPWPDDWANRVRIAPARPEMLSTFNDVKKLFLQCSRDELLQLKTRLGIAGGKKTREAMADLLVLAYRCTVIDPLLDPFRLQWAVGDAVDRDCPEPTPQHELADISAMSGDVFQQFYIEHFPIIKPARIHPVFRSVLHRVCESLNMTGDRFWAVNLDKKALQCAHRNFELLIAYLMQDAQTVAIETAKKR